MENELKQSDYYARHRSAAAAAAVFTALAIVESVVGVLVILGFTGFELRRGASGLGILVGDLLILGVTAVASAMSAFFALVLNLLVEIEHNTREAALNVHTGRVPRRPLH